MLIGAIGSVQTVWGLVPNAPRLPSLNLPVIPGWAWLIAFLIVLCCGLFEGSFRKSDALSMTIKTLEAEVVSLKELHRQLGDVEYRDVMFFWVNGHWPPNDKFHCLIKDEGGYDHLSGEYSRASDSMRSFLRSGSLRSWGMQSEDESRGYIEIPQDFWAQNRVEGYTLHTPGSLVRTNPFKINGSGLAEVSYYLPRLNRKEVEVFCSLHTQGRARPLSS